MAWRLEGFVLSQFKSREQWRSVEWRLTEKAEGRDPCLLACQSRVR